MDRISSTAGRALIVALVAIVAVLYLARCVAASVKAGRTWHGGTVQHVETRKGY